MSFSVRLFKSRYYIGGSSGSTLPTMAVGPVASFRRILHWNSLKFVGTTSFRVRDSHTDTTLNELTKPNDKKLMKANDNKVLHKHKMIDIIQRDTKASTTTASTLTTTNNSTMDSIVVASNKHTKTKCLPGDHTTRRSVSSLSGSSSNEDPESPSSGSSSVSTSSSSSSSSSVSQHNQKNFQIHQSFRDIVDLYDGFIFDQYGVILDGKKGLDGAADCLSELHAKKKKMCILSNSCAPPDYALTKYPQFGLDPSVFVGAVTSGGEAIRYIQSTYGQQGQQEQQQQDTTTTTPTGKISKCIWFTWANGEGDMCPPDDFLTRCGPNVTTATTVDEADFILDHGCSVWRKSSTTDDDMVPLTGVLHDGTMDTVDPILQQAVDKNLPLICCNPDIGALSATTGEIDYMPGKIALRYEEMGGECIYFGKPHPTHFEACIRMLGISDRTRIVHVGDSLQHDIKGANDTGIDSIFITSGIHGSELGVTKFGEFPTGDIETKLVDLFDKEGQTPTHVIPAVQF